MFHTIRMIPFVLFNIKKLAYMQNFKYLSKTLINKR